MDLTEEISSKGIPIQLNDYGYTRLNGSEYPMVDRAWLKTEAIEQQNMLYFYRQKINRLYSNLFKNYNKINKMNNNF
jgi:hypothetical protein